MTEFCRLVEHVYCQPLDHRRPLWQAWVVEGLDGGRVALLALVHHAYADGSGMRAIPEAMTSDERCDTPQSAEPPPPRPSHPPCGEAYVIEGLRDGQLVVFVKAHHALADGVGGLKMFYGSLSAEPNDAPRPVWARRPTTRAVRESTQGPVRRTSPTSR